MKKGDKIVGLILLITVLITLSAASIYKIVVKGSDNIAVIKREGKVLKSIDLNRAEEPEEFTIKTDKGGFNTILVKDKAIAIKDADCPHKECVKSGSISEPGQIVVCLPYKLIISIKGQPNKGIDGATY